jgi:hypothetical protein
MIITDANGDEIEVFSQAELDEKYKGFVSPEEAETLRSELAKKEEASKNNAILRKKAEEAEKNKGGLETEFNSYKEETEKKFQELSTKLSEKEVNEYITSLSTDPDVVEKIKFNLGRISGEDTKQNVYDAYRLSVDNASIPSFVSASGAGAGFKAGSVSDDVKELAAKMGITEADFKKANIQ